MITDRERDALVAELVMGMDLTPKTYSEHEWVLADQNWDWWKTCERCGQTDGLIGEIPPSPQCVVRPSIPPYSTYITSAWQVLQKMKENDGIFYEFIMALGGIVNADYDAFTKSEIEHLMFKLSPEIICRAALYAVGYKGDE